MERQQPSPFRLGYRPSLDGLRGVAILMVVLDHAIQPKFGSYGFVGVNIFFELSGFLITTLLIEEWLQTGKISLMDFYKRRALRLLPALLCMLCAFMIYCAFTHTRTRWHADLQELLAALFYYMNWALAFYFIRARQLSHTWSLSVEEQFYILWPGLLLLLLRWAKRASISNYILLGAFACALARFLVAYQSNIWPARMQDGLDTRADALLVGCALGAALCFGQIPTTATMTTLFRWASWLSVAGLAIASHNFSPSDHRMVSFGWAVLSLFGVTILLTLVIVPRSLLQKILENAALVNIGRVSYGLYLWHYPILYAAREHKNWSPLCQQIVFIVGTVILTLASYFLVERPFLAMKKRLGKAV